MRLQARAGLEIHCLPLGELQTNCYVLHISPSDEAPPAHDPTRDPTKAHRLQSVGSCWIVDPGGDAPRLLEFLRRKDLPPQRILLTHGHGDHIGAVRELKAAYPAAIVTISPADAAMLTDPVLNFSAMFGPPIVCEPADELVTPGMTLIMGPHGLERPSHLTWQVLNVAGHTPGGLAFYCAAAGVVVTGDALFAGSIGRTDLPGGDMGTLLTNIHRNLMTLPDDTLVLPGHGSPSTIGEERRYNEFLGGSGQTP